MLKYVLSVDALARLALSLICLSSCKKTGLVLIAVSKLSREAVLLLIPKR
jgi:hypothetical protein